MDAAPKCPTSNAGRIQHNAARASDGAGRQVLPEFAADDAIVAMGPAHLAPNDAELCVVDLALCLVDVGNPAKQVRDGRVQRDAST